MPIFSQSPSHFAQSKEITKSKTHPPLQGAAVNRNWKTIVIWFRHFHDIVWYVYLHLPEIYAKCRYIFKNISYMDPMRYGAFWGPHLVWLQELLPQSFWKNIRRADDDEKPWQTLDWLSWLGWLGYGWVGWGHGWVGWVGKIGWFSPIWEICQAYHEVIWSVRATNYTHDYIVCIPYYIYRILWHLMVLGHAFSNHVD